MLFIYTYSLIMVCHGAPAYSDWSILWPHTIQLDEVYVKDSSLEIDCHSISRYLRAHHSDYERQFKDD